MDDFALFAQADGQSGARVPYGFVEHAAAHLGPARGRGLKARHIVRGKGVFEQARGQFRGALVGCVGGLRAHGQAGAHAAELREPRLDDRGDHVVDGAALRVALDQLACVGHQVAVLVARDEALVEPPFQLEGPSPVAALFKFARHVGGELFLLGALRRFGDEDGFLRPGGVRQGKTPPLYQSVGSVSSIAVKSWASPPFKGGRSHAAPCMRQESGVRAHRILSASAPFAAAMSRSAHLPCAAHGGGNRRQSHVRADAAQCCFAS